jgi:hypothetical protein
MKAQNVYKQYLKFSSYLKNIARLSYKGNWLMLFSEIIHVYWDRTKPVTEFAVVIQNCWLLERGSVIKLSFIENEWHVY